MDDTELWLARRQRDESPDWGLFAPAARTSDPETSKKAEAQVRPRRGSQAMRLLQVYAELGPLTDEVATQKAGLVNGWKRCSDLRNAGYIKPTGQLSTSSMGAQVQVCAITDLGRSRLA